MLLCSCAPVLLCSCASVLVSPVSESPVLICAQLTYYYAQYFTMLMLQDYLLLNRRTSVTSVCNCTCAVWHWQAIATGTMWSGGRLTHLTMRVVFGFVTLVRLNGDLVPKPRPAMSVGAVGGSAGTGKPVKTERRVG